MLLNVSPFALRVLAALFLIAAGVLFFATEHTKVFAALLVLGNVLSLAAHFVERPSETRT